MRVWRICNVRHAATAFSGEGARLFSARWNPAGVPMVYASTSLSLATIEVLVHLGAEDTPDELVSIEAELPVDEESCERIDLRGLPEDWRKEKHPALPLIGAEWVLARRSLVLLAPSVAVDGEWNALVNPEHPDAAKIKVAKAKPFRFDERMFKTKS
jgi:RES domain-containing protein